MSSPSSSSSSSSFDFFGGYDEVLFDEITNDHSRKASKQEKQELLEFIGGFEYWNQLDTPLQMHVVGFLDYWNRCNFALSSHESNRLINETPLYTSPDLRQKDGGIRLKPGNLAAMCKSDYEQQKGQEMEIKSIILRIYCIEIRTVTGMNRSWRYSQRAENCRVTSKSSLEDKFKCSEYFVIENGDAGVEFANRIQKMMGICWNHLEILDVEAGWRPTGVILPDRLPNLKQLRVVDESRQNGLFWISKLSPESPPLDQFVFREDYPTDPLSFDQLNIPQIINSKSLTLHTKLSISEDQFLSLRCSKIRISAEIRIEVFEEFVRRWVDDEIDNDDFSFCLVWFYENSLPRRYRFTRFNFTEHHLHDRTSPHYHNFYQKFFQYRSYSTLFQVPKRSDHNKSVSVLLSDHRLMVVRTGFPCIRDGRSATEYRFPDELNI